MTDELGRAMEGCTKYRPSFPFVIQEKHFEVCQKLRSAFSNTLDDRLRYVKKFAEIEASKVFCSTFWKILAQVSSFFFLFLHLLIYFIAVKIRQIIT